MTNFARLLARGARLHTPGVRSLLALSGSVAAFLLAAAPAQAVVTEVSGATVGLQPRTEELFEPSGNITNNEGNPIVSGASVYAVYWDPGAWFHHEWVSKLDEFFQDMGAASGEYGTIFSALGQYRDRANAQASYRSVFKGAYSDTAPYPAEKCSDPEPLLFGQVACVTDAQIREQLQSFIATHATEKGMHAVYYVLTPPGVTVCLDEASKHCSDFNLSETEREKGERASESYEASFCSYHGAINPSKAPQGDGNTILYGTIPWTAGYEGRPWDFLPGASTNGQAYDCQDGGWNPEKGVEKHETIAALTTAEEEALAKMDPEERATAEKKRELTGPHIEEPNQEPEEKGEEGDWAAGLSDPLVNQIAVEQANIVTDPLLTSWHNQGSGFEVTDECRNVFASTAGHPVEGEAKARGNTEAGTISNEMVAGGRFYINNVANEAELHRPRCVGGVGLVPRFTSPNPVNSGELVDFDGMESTVTEFKGPLYGPAGPPSTTYATFSWNFGDGSPVVTGYAPGAPMCEAPWLTPCAASAFHSYTYGGTYTVTLRITDVAGNVSVVSHEVTVAGPSAPGATVPGSSSSGTSSSGTSSSGGSTSTTGGPGKGAGKPAVVPGKPVATAAVVSRSLRSALRNGLAVGYTVNEQVAGRFEVLMARSLAAKLKIPGTPATGLPPGTAPQLVIAKAVLVTTKGGRSVVHVKFPKRVAARLGHAHGVPLMLRLIVRNAASANPETTTVISAATLVG